MAERERPTRQQLSKMLLDKGLKDLLDNSGPFRKFLWTLFVDASIFYPTYSRRSPYDTSWNEGRRALGLEVLHRLKSVRPDILGLIEREGNLLERDIAEAEQTLNEDQDASQSIPDDDQPYDPQPE